MSRPTYRAVRVGFLGVLLLAACNPLKMIWRDDKAITTSIQAALFRDPVLKSRDIKVDSRNGVVTLAGSVGSGQERSTVERIAACQKGVQSVVNMLNVATPPPAPLPVSLQIAGMARRQPSGPWADRPALPDTQNPGAQYRA